MVYSLVQIMWITADPEHSNWLNNEQQCATMWGATNSCVTWGREATFLAVNFITKCFGLAKSDLREQEARNVQSAKNIRKLYSRLPLRRWLEETTVGRCYTCESGVHTIGEMDYFTIYESHPSWIYYIQTTVILDSYSDVFEGLECITDVSCQLSEKPHISYSFAYWYQIDTVTVKAADTDICIWLEIHAHVH